MKHLTREQRYVIESLHRRGISNTEIADEIGIHKSNVGRELKRNSSKRGKYQAGNAHKYAQERKERFFYNRKFTNQVQALVDKYISEEQWSPEQIDAIENNSTIEFLQKDYPEREKMKRIIANKFIKVKRNFEMI